MGNAEMRYNEITQVVLAQEGRAPCTMIEKRFAIVARDLGRALRWFEQESDADVASLVVQGWILAVQFACPQDANRFANGAVGRARWRAADRTVVYLADRKSVDADPATDIAFTQQHLDQLGLLDRGELIDGLTIECLFPSPQLASMFAESTNAADLSGSQPQTAFRADLMARPNRSPRD